MIVYQIGVKGNIAVNEKSKVTGAMIPPYSRRFRADQ